MERRFGLKVIAHLITGGMEIKGFIYLIGPIICRGDLNHIFWIYGLGTLNYLAWMIFELLNCDRRAKLF